MPLPAESGLYIHFPFCRRRCHYCDFNTYAVPAIPVLEYTEAILTELRARAHELAGTRLVSIFLGGGTPGLWGPGPVGRVLREAFRLLQPLGDIEVTIEVNPGETDEATLRAYREEAGCNRVSFGVQALTDRLLASMDRIHDAKEARAALRAVVSAGYTRWSADMMFGLPGQSLRRFLIDLDGLLAHEPPHISLYNLMVEPSTPLYLKVRDGKVRLPPDGAQVRMLEAARERMQGAGYRWYEISNYARPGEESVHNLLYWTGRPYLALGAGAHAFLPASGEDGVLGFRRSNARKYTEYMERVRRDGHAVVFEEAIDSLTHARERMMTGLRLLGGVDLDDVARSTGVEPQQAFGEAMAGLEAEGLVTRAGSFLRLTPRAVPVSDSVFLRFF